MKLNTIVLCGLASAVSGSQYCNPLFKIFENTTGFDYGDVAVPVYTNQSPGTLNVTEDKFTCPNVKNSCCSNSIMDAISIDYARVRAKIIDTAYIFEDNEVGWAQAEQSYIKDYNDNMQVPNSTNDTPEKLHPLVLQYYENARTWLRDSRNAYGKCLDRVLEHHVGFLCLACDSDWEKYGTYEMINDEYQVSLRYKNATCDKIVSDCSGIADASQKFMISSYHIVGELNKYVNPDLQLRTPEMRQQSCGSVPCRDDLCNDMIHGFLFTAPLKPLYEAIVYVNNMEAANSAKVETEHHTDTSLVVVDELSRVTVSAASFLASSSYMVAGKVESKRARRNTKGNLVITYVSESEEESIGAAYDPIGVHTALDTMSEVGDEGNGGDNTAHNSMSNLLVCCACTMFIIHLF
eukprot:CFRG4127T1